MKLYLNEKLESIPVLNNLVTLLEGVIKDPKIQLDYKTPEDIYKTTHLYDPVRDFLEFYIESSGIKMDEGRKLYIINSLYAAKGAPKVFEIFDEVFETHVNYTFNFPILDIVEIEDLKIDNVVIYIIKFINMLYYLLYFTDITIHIKNLILSLRGSLVQYNSSILLGYDYVNERIGESSIIINHEFRTFK